MRKRILRKVREVIVVSKKRCFRLNGNRKSNFASCCSQNDAHLAA